MNSDSKVGAPFWSLVKELGDYEGPESLNALTKQHSPPPKIKIASPRRIIPKKLISSPPQKPPEPSPFRAWTLFKQRHDKEQEKERQKQIEEPLRRKQRIAEAEAKRLARKRWIVVQQLAKVDGMSLSCFLFLIPKAKVAEARINQSTIQTIQQLEQAESAEYQYVAQQRAEAVQRLCGDLGGRLTEEQQKARDQAFQRYLVIVIPFT